MAQKLSWGPAAFFYNVSAAQDSEDRREEYVKSSDWTTSPDDVFARLPPEYERGGSDIMGREESVFVQYHSLELFPDAFRVYSEYTAGPGQLVCGRSDRHCVDLCLVPRPGDVRMINYHSDYYHYAGHSKNCASFNSVPDRDLVFNDETAESDSFAKGYVAALNDRLAALVVSPPNEKEGEFEWMRGRCPRFSYEVFTSCDLFHGRTYLHDGRRRELKEHLRVKHGEKALLGFPAPGKMKAAELRRRILEDEEFGG